MTQPQFTERRVSLFANTPSEHSMIDDRGNPTFIGDGPGCTGLSFVEPPELFIPMYRIYKDYIQERLHRRGSDVRRAVSGFRRVCDFFDPLVDPTKLKLQDWARYEDHRYSEGVCAPTVRREMTYHLAAMNHARKRERIVAVPYLEKPSGDVVKERRAATEEEYQLLMRKGVMSWRIRMFFRLAYWTGHRAKAIEQLTFARVNWSNRTIDFNLPGVNHRNKRRNASFPITDELMGFLEAAKRRHELLGLKDDYVIGVGRNGKPSCTWRKCKAAWASIGVKDEGFARHAFRKTFVTERVKAGKPLAMVAKLIEDSPETAAKHYAKFVTEDMRAIAER